MLIEVISVTPAMRPNCRSSGVATAEAIVSGLAPGRPQRPEWLETPPAVTAIPAENETPETRQSRARVSSVVATGLRMKGAEMFMAGSAGNGSPTRPSRRKPDKRLANRSNAR